jgi:RNA polymerase sigma-70 factor (ECF subfamily)
MKAPWHEKLLLFRLYEDKSAEAFGELYDLYVEPIYRFILFKVKTATEAEDLTAEVFLKTWDYILRRERKIDNFKAFIYRLARNAVADYYRQGVQSESSRSHEEMELIPEAIELNIATVVEKNSELVGIERGLRTLKDEYREILILRYVEDYSVADIAKIVEKSRGAVRVNLHRALNALRQEVLSKEQPK